jgi:hypothetical protein
MAGENVGIDLSQYKAAKAKGTLSLVPVANSKTRVMLFKQNFDAQTGEELDPVAVPMNPRALHSVKAALQAQIDGADAMLADMKALGLDITPPAPAQT